MNDIVNEIPLKDILEDINNLINKIEELGLEKKIKNTKVYKWLSSLENEFNKNYEDDIKRLIKLNKYRRVLNFIIENSSNIKPITIKEIISGSELILDDSDKSENYLFEIDIADRILKIMGRGNKLVDLNSNTDIIFDNEIFVECKKIHRENSFKDNLKKANKQIQNAKLNLDQKAFIALELTNVFNKNDVIELSNKISEYFRVKYKELENSENYIHDSNFRKIVQSLFNSKLEFLFQNMIKEFYRKNKGFKFDDHIIGIFYQYDTYFRTPTSDLIAIRGATFYPLKEKARDFFMSLVTGI
ncbi:hypothetical protein [Haemophilus influenzae]|uniref:hypothetical protein n=1 Tax=Haemophilus influenzae TaxID=727 RepID=UPI003DA6BE0F